MHKTTLPNGIRVITQSMPHSNSTSIDLGIDVGSRHELEHLSGVSHFIEHLLFKGTENKPSAIEISETIEKTGGILNAATEHESTIYWCKVVATERTKGLELLLDMVQNSLFNPKEIELERHVIIEEINSVNDFPNSRADAMLDELMWEGDPLGRDIAGNKDSVASMSRIDIIDFMNSHYTGNNIVCSVAGRLEHDQMVESVERCTRSIIPGNKTFLPQVSSNQCFPKHRYEYRDTEQIHMSLGFPGVSRKSPDRYPVDLLAAILGEGMSSRLFSELREKRGLVYDIGSGTSHFHDTGVIHISAGLKKTEYLETIEIIFREIQRCMSDVNQGELDKIKSLFAGRLQLRLEDTKFVSGWNISHELAYGEALSPENVLALIKDVALDDVINVAHKYLSKQKANISLVGPIKDSPGLLEILETI